MCQEGRFRCARQATTLQDLALKIQQHSRATMSRDLDDFDVCGIACERFSPDESSSLCPKVGLCGHSFSAKGLSGWANARKTDDYNKLKKLLPCAYKCSHSKNAASEKKNTSNKFDMIKAFRPNRLITNFSLCQALRVIQKCRSHGSQESVAQWDFDKCSLCRQEFFVNSKKCIGSKEYHPKAPIVGVCGHTFCSECLYSLHAEALANSFCDNLKNIKCPKCNKRNAFHIENLIDNITFRGAIRFWKSFLEEEPINTGSRREEEEPVFLENDNSDVETTARNLCAEAPINTSSSRGEEEPVSLENDNTDVETTARILCAEAPINTAKGKEESVLIENKHADVKTSSRDLCAEAAIKRMSRVYRPPEPKHLVSKEEALDIYNLGRKYTMRETAAAKLRAIRYYQQAADAGLDKAQHEMGILYQKGGKQVDSRKNYRLALKFFRLAADQGYAESQLALAKLLYRQNLELENAAKHCKSALENGKAEACTLLAYMFQEGKGVEQNTAESLRLLQQGTQGGDIHAQLMVADILKSNKEKAFGFYKMAADSGDAASQLEVGMILEEGCDGVKCDLMQALQYYEASAKQGVLKAQLALGRIFKQDSLDLEKSAHNFRLAADQGDRHAQLNLALLLEKNKANEESLREAA